VKFQPPRSSTERENYIAAMWLMFLRAPGRETAPGEVVNLGEIGAVKTKDWERLTPYSLAQPILRRSG
jgi:hypothetical protein